VIRRAQVTDRAPVTGRPSDLTRPVRASAPPASTSCCASTTPSCRANRCASQVSIDRTSRTDRSHLHAPQRRRATYRIQLSSQRRPHRSGKQPGRTFVALSPFTSPRCLPAPTRRPRGRAVRVGSPHVGDHHEHRRHIATGSVPIRTPRSADGQPPQPSIFGAHVGARHRFGGPRLGPPERTVWPRWLEFRRARGYRAAHPDPGDPPW